MHANKNTKAQIQTISDTVNAEHIPKVLPLPLESQHQQVGHTGAGRIHA